MSDLHGLLAEMVKIDSTNPSLVPGAPGEAELARYIARRLEAAALEVDLWDVAPGRPNVLGRLPGAGRADGRPGRSLLLCGHTDVVAAPPESFQPALRDGRLYGRGGPDMKSGLAAAIVAAEAIARSGRPLAGDLLVVGLADEEWASIGAEALPERYRPDAAVLTECTGLDVVVEHGGFVWFDVESRGVEAAGADPDHGVDGIALLAPVLDGIGRLDEAFAGRPPASYGRASIHASTIAGGDQYPVYPARCVLGVERCLVAGESVAQAEAEMNVLLETALAADARFDGEVTMVVGREPVTLDPNEAVVRALTDATAVVTGEPARLRGDIGWMDSGVLVEAGIPCAIFGPTGQGEHTAVEWVDLASVETCAKVLEEAARLFCV